MYEDLVGSYKSSLNQLKDLGDLYELALEENNTSIQNEVLESIKNLRKLAKKMKLIVFYQMSLTLLIVI